MALTKQDLKNIGNLIDEKLDRRFATQEKHFDKKLDEKLTRALTEQKKYLDNKLEQGFTAQRQYLDDKLEQGFTAQKQHLDDKLDRKVDSLRVLIEELRSDIKFGFEARDPHEEKLQIHDTTLKKHEKRITTLEDYAYTKDRLK